jgi:hypothetical protein
VAHVVGAERLVFDNQDAKTAKNGCFHGSNLR